MKNLMNLLWRVSNPQLTQSLTALMLHICAQGLDHAEIARKACMTLVLPLIPRWSSKMIGYNLHPTENVINS